MSAPTITLAGTSGNNGWYTSSVTATITNPNSTGTIKYILSGATNQDGTTYTEKLTLTESGLTKIVAYVVDSDGYTSDYSYVNVKIDKDPPKDLSIDVTGTEGTNSWYTSDVVVEITAEDTNSGIYSYVYTIKKSKDGGNTFSETVASNVEVTGESKEITFKTDGEYEITVYAKDRAGNKSATVTKTIYKDSTAPSSFIPTVDTDTLTYSSFDVLATTTDAVSGVSYYKFYIKEVNSSGDYELKQSSSSTTCTFDGLTESTAYSIYVVAVDKAGNEETSSVITVKTAEEDRPIRVKAEIVEELPTSVVIEVTATDENGDELTSGDDFTTTITVTDSEGNDVTEDVTITDNGDGTYTIGGLDQETDYEIEVTVTDNEGNEDTTTISTTTTKDTTAPTVSITVTDITTNSAVVNITATDDVSSLDGATYTIKVTDSNGNWTAYTTTSTTYKIGGLDENSTYEVTVTVSDETGNPGSDTTTFTTGTMPTAATSGLTLTPSTENWTNETITVTATLSTNYTGYGVLMSTNRRR